jgi:hypothetical protein
MCLDLPESIASAMEFNISSSPAQPPTLTY